MPAHPASRHVVPHAALGLTLLLHARQQLEGIRVKQEQREAVTKKGKDRKEQLQGETAGEKPRPAGRARALPTHIFHSAKGCGGKVPAPWGQTFWQGGNKFSPTPSLGATAVPFLLLILLPALICSVFCSLPCASCPVSALRPAPCLACTA